MFHLRLTERCTRAKISPKLIRTVDTVSQDKVMGAHPDTWKPWVWAMFAFNTLFGVIFAILSWATFSGFRQIMHTATTVLPAGTDSDAWWWLFDGAAVSAFFVVIIVALTVLLALRYMLLTRRSLCHPRSSFGRGLMVATGLFAALHFVNIGTHFLSFVPSMQHWVNDYGVHFNRVLLTATVAFGYMSAALNLIFAMMLLFWRDKDAEALDRVALTHMDNGGGGLDLGGLDEQLEEEQHLSVPGHSSAWGA